MEFMLQPYTHGTKLLKLTKSERKTKSQLICEPFHFVLSSMFAYRYYLLIAPLYLLAYLSHHKCP